MIGDWRLDWLMMSIGIVDGYNGMLEGQSVERRGSEWGWVLVGLCVWRGVGWWWYVFWILCGIVLIMINYYPCGGMV